MSKPKELLLEQREALWGYLDALLQEIPEEPDTLVVEMAEASEPPPVEPAPEPVAPLTAKVVPLVREVEPDVPAAPVIEPERTVVQTAEPEAAAQPLEEVESAPEGVPAWAETQFQALLFKVDKLTLAVPLVKLHSVIPWSDKIAPLPNQPAWCHGLLRYREQNVQIVDTGRMVIPADRRDKLEPQPPKHILIVGDGRWGLACSELGDVIRLEPDEVKWRSSRSRRPWLAGTVLAHLCALMDTEAFAGMLANEKARAADKRVKT